MNRREVLALPLALAVARLSTGANSVSLLPAEHFCRRCGGSVWRGSRAFLLDRDRFLEHICLPCLATMGEVPCPSSYCSAFADEVFLRS